MTNSRAYTTLTCAAFLWAAVAWHATPATAAARIEQDGAKTVWTGVYTDAQAERGKKQYLQYCASCHSQNLSGTDEGPGLVGQGFLAPWIDLTVNDLFERVRISMPLDRPGGLSRVTYADVLAYVFRVNKMPSGETELTPDTALMSRIRIVSGTQH